jgi:hypothetical protein
MGKAGYSFGYSKKPYAQIAAENLYKLHAADQLIRKGIKKYKLDKPTHRVLKKGFNKFAGAAAGAALGFITADVPGAIAGGYHGYHAGKRLD